ncbi:MAG: C40 family peptidase, partial [Sulfurovum sp.]|nr:C40 family peptidase [Sulfurovaceae bacterium]
TSVLTANSRGYPAIPIVINESIKLTINVEWIDGKNEKDEYKNKKLIGLSKYFISKMVFPKSIFYFDNYINNSTHKRVKDNYIIVEAKGHLGKRYVWGANGPSRFDCSGFTSYVYKKMGIKIPRVSINQGKVGKKVRRSRLRKGDLVFFDTSRRRRGYINHVGIYIGDHKFIHASSSKRKVVISSLDKKFYKARFKWGRRLQ